MDLKETLFRSLIKVFNDQEDANLSDENRVSKELEKINKKEEEEEDEEDEEEQQEQKEEENNHHDDDESDEINGSDVSEIESEAPGESPEDESLLNRRNINFFNFAWFSYY